MNRGFKWTAFGLALIMMLVLGVKATPLSERAIVCGMAIDKEDGLYQISAQILMPSEDESKSAGYIISTVEAETISGALSKMSSETSMLVAMSHCDLMILGESIIANEAYSILDYLVRNAYLSENILLLTCEGSGREILDCKTAYSEMSSFYIQQAMEVYGDYKDASRRNAKEFLAGYNTHNRANWLTKIKKTETQKKVSNSSSSSQTSSAAQDKEYVFEFYESAIIRGESLVFTADARVTSGINYVKKTLRKGAISIVGDSGEAVNLYIAKSRCKLDFEPEGYTVTAKIKLQLVLKERLKEGGTDYYLEKVELSEAETERVKAWVAGDIAEAFEKTRAHGVDIFDIYGGFYGKAGKKWHDMSENYLEKAVLKTEIKVSFT